MPFTDWLDNFDTLEMCHLCRDVVRGGKVGTLCPKVIHLQFSIGVAFTVLLLNVDFYNYIIQFFVVLC